MNILMATDIFFTDSMGGSSRMVWEIGKGLTTLGHRIQILSGGAPGAKEEEQIQGLRVIRFTREKVSPWRALRLARQAARRVEQPLDIVFDFHPFSAVAAQGASCFAGIPHLYFFNSSWAQEYLIRRKFKGRTHFFQRLLALVYHGVEKKALDQARHIVTISQYMADLLEKIHGTLAEKISVIALGADVQKFRPAHATGEAREKLKWPLNKTILLTVRNLEPRMGLENLLEALPPLLAQDFALHLYVVGHGSLREFLEKKAASLNLQDHVSFSGEVPDDILPLCYQAADVFVLPTREMEGFGLVTVEALASGCPVVGTPVGATPEILSPLDATLLTRDASPKALTEGLARFLSRRPQWPDLRKKASEYARKKYSWDRVVKEIQEITLKVLAS